MLFPSNSSPSSCFVRSLYWRNWHISTLDFDRDIIQCKHLRVVGGRPTWNASNRTLNANVELHDERTKMGNVEIRMKQRRITISANGDDDARKRNEKISRIKWDRVNAIAVKRGNWMHGKHTQWEIVYLHKNGAHNRQLTGSNCWNTSRMSVSLMPRRCRSQCAVRKLREMAMGGGFRQKVLMVMMTTTTTMTAIVLACLFFGIVE